MATATTSAVSANAASSSHEAEYQEARWRPAMALPCRLTVEVPFPDFLVADYLGLRLGSVLSTRWSVAREVPLHINGILVGWGELEAAGQRLAVRVTELA